MKRTFVALIGALLTMAAVAAAQDVKPVSSQASQSVREAPARETYRLDYTVTEMEDGKKLNARTYSVMCEDEGNQTRGSLKVGSRVPVATGEIATGHGDGGTSLVNTQFTYLDVGINIDARLEATPGGGLSLQSNLEMSSVADASAPYAPKVNAPVIRQLKVWTNNAIAVGKPIVIATADDVASRRQFQIQVMATKVK